VKENECKIKYRVVLCR